MLPVHGILFWYYSKFGALSQQLNIPQTLDHVIFGTRFMKTVLNHTLKHYNQPRIVTTQTKLTQKVDHFTVFESFISTSCCSHKLLPNKIEKFGWLDVQCSIRDVYVG